MVIRRYGICIVSAAALFAASGCSQEAENDAPAAVEPAPPFADEPPPAAEPFPDAGADVPPPEPEPDLLPDGE